MSLSHPSSIKKHLIYSVASLLVIICLGFSSSSYSLADDISPTDTQIPAELRIGILSKRGPLIVQQRWSEMTFYLQKIIPEYRFVIVPLSFDAVRPAVQNKQIDFLLTNSGMFVDLSFQHELFAIATLKRKIAEKAYTKFGSVIFTRSERDGINILYDLKDSDIAAVDQQSLGGWIAAAREFDAAGFDIQTANSIDFLGTHDAVVYAVENRIADVGIVRTDTLERMASEGKIQLSTFRALPAPKELSQLDNFDHDFPLLHTTRLYPEWPIASLSHVSGLITEKVSSALLLMPANSKAAIDAQIMGWTIPKNYSDVDLAFRELNMGFYEKIQNRTISNIIIQYWIVILASVLVSTLLLMGARYIININSKLKISQDKLKKLSNYDQLTELPNRNLFLELASKYLHQALREEQSSIIAIVQLAGIKHINDTYGYDIGEQAIKEFSSRLSQVISEFGLVGQLDSHSFIILLNKKQIQDDADEIFKEVVRTINEPFVTANGFNIELKCWIGASQYPNQGTLLKSLIQNANRALDRAKLIGTNEFLLYDNS